jgi:hypothetical protein
MKGTLDINISLWMVIAQANAKASVGGRYRHM